MTFAAAGGLDQDHVGDASGVDQRVSGIVDQRTSRHGNVQDLVGSTLDGAAEANQGHLVGAQLTSTASQLTGDVCVLSDNQCLHYKTPHLSDYRAALTAAASFSMAPSSAASTISCLRATCSGARHSTVVRAAAEALSAPATSIGFLPAARMSFMPGMRGSATSGVTETTAGRSTSTTSMQSLEGAGDDGGGAVDLDLAGCGHDRPAELLGQLHVDLLQVVVGGTVAADDGVHVADPGQHIGQGGSRGGCIQVGQSVVGGHVQMTHAASHDVLLELELSMSLPPTVMATASSAS